MATSLRELTTSEDRSQSPYHHIDPGFINYRECYTLLGSRGVSFFEQYRRPGDDHFVRLYNNRLMVDLLLKLCKEANIETLGEILNRPREGMFFSSTELLEGNDDVYEKKRIRNRILLPYNYDKEVYLEFSTMHFVAETGRTEQCDEQLVSVIGKIRKVSEREVIAYPLIMGAPSFDHPLNKDISVSVDLMWYGYDWYEIFPEDIREFALCKDVVVETADEWVNYMQQLPEREVKERLGAILSDSVNKDWGGEQADHMATIHFGDRQANAAFLLKGPAYFREMTPSMLGKNGDQIYRLAQMPVQVLIVQHCHNIGPAVRATLRAFAVAPHSPRWYCLIDGKYTYRILKAYEKL
ncbi:MAG: hypothetical protein JW934_24940 [Anaerolineae bacterium]|nr:hypothetical protein [Anaerolineae bacterium]